MPSRTGKERPARNSRPEVRECGETKTKMSTNRGLTAAMKSGQTGKNKQAVERERGKRVEKERRASCAEKANIHEQIGESTPINQNGRVGKRNPGLSRSSVRQTRKRLETAKIIVFDWQI